MKIIGEVLEPKFRPSPDQSDCAKEFAARDHDVMAKDMFDARTNTSPTLIARSLRSYEGDISGSFVLNPGAQLSPLPLGVDGLRTISRIRPDVTASGVGT